MFLLAHTRITRRRQSEEGSLAREFLITCPIQRIGLASTPAARLPSAMKVQKHQPCLNFFLSLPLKNVQVKPWRPIILAADLRICGRTQDFIPVLLLLLLLELTDSTPLADAATGEVLSFCRVLAVGFLDVCP